MKIEGVIVDDRILLNAYINCHFNGKKLGLVGPKSSEIVDQLGASSLNQLPYFNHCSCSIGEIAVEAVRLSYVGEAGWETNATRFLSNKYNFFTLTNPIQALTKKYDKKSN